MTDIEIYKTCQPSDANLSRVSPEELREKLGRIADAIETLPAGSRFRDRLRLLREDLRAALKRHEPDGQSSLF